MIRRMVAVVCATVAAAAMSAAPATGAPADASGLEVSPGKIDRDLDGRSLSYQVTLVNRFDHRVTVSLEVTGLSHDLSGAPLFPSSKKADKALRISETDLEMEPGQKRLVDVEATIPSGDGGLYAGVVAEFAPVASGPRASSVETRTRVASFVMLRGPKPWKESIKILDVGVTDATEPGMTVYATVENTGSVHVRPKGFAVTSSEGLELGRVTLTPETVLPGAARRLVGVWNPTPVPDGSVTVEVRFSDPPATATKTLNFSQGKVPDPRAAIADLIATELPAAESADATAPRTLAVSLGLRNTGEVTLDQPVVTLVAREGGAERARVVLPQDELRAGDTHDITWRTELPPGVYEITAEATQGSTLLDRSVTGVRLGVGKPAALEGARGVLGGVAGGLAIGVGGLVGFFWRRRRNRRPPAAPVTRIAATPPTAAAAPAKPLTRTAKR